jgi:hypothetical protein
VEIHDSISEAALNEIGVTTLLQQATAGRASCGTNLWWKGLHNL